MTTIQEKNKAIAEFMGLKLSNYSPPEGYLIQQEFQGQVFNMRSELKYNLSWDWLMPVVQKIAKMVIEIDWDENYISMMKKWKLLARTLESVNMKNIYATTLQFILWYNQQSKTQQP